MKKIKQILLLLIMFIPILVKADMAAPDTLRYEMVVTNPNGIDYYEYNNNELAKKGTINKDETFTVIFEYTDGYYVETKNKEAGYIKSIDGAVLLVDEIDPEGNTIYDGIKRADKAKKAIVYSEAGVALQKGPANAYATILTIPKDTKLTYQTYYDGGNGEMYLYVTYNNKKGWIDIENEKVVIENDTQYIFLNDVTTSCGTIPENTIITPEYKTVFDPSQKGIFNYNNCSFTLEIFRSTDALPLSYQTIGMANKDLKIRKTAENVGEEVGVIPNGSKFTILATEPRYDELPVAHYVQYDNVRGWIRTIYEEDYVYVEDASEPIILPNDPNTSAASSEAQTQQTPNENNRFNMKEIIALITAGAIIISLTAIVTIVLVNKKNKTKKD